MNSSADRTERIVFTHTSLGIIPMFQSSVQTFEKAAVLKSFAKAEIQLVVGFQLRSFRVDPMLPHQLNHRVHALDRRTRFSRQRADQTLISLLHLARLAQSQVATEAFE